MEVDEVNALIPREYQIELAEAAVKKNIIAFLPTGAGKTLVAALVIKQMTDFLLRKRQLVVIVVPSVILVHQQAAAIEPHTLLRVGSYWGKKIEVTAGERFQEWGRDEWAPHLAEDTGDQVLVMTPAILKNLLDRGYLPVARLGLVVFDECHHAVQGSPYNTIMKEHIKRAPEAERPKILGLTASPLNAKAKPGCTVEEAASTLERNLTATIVTHVDDVAVRQAAPLPTLITARYGLAWQVPASELAKQGARFSTHACSGPVGTARYLLLEHGVYMCCHALKSMTGVPDNGRLAAAAMDISGGDDGVAAPAAASGLAACTSSTPEAAEDVAAVLADLIHMGCRPAVNCTTMDAIADSVLSRITAHEVQSLLLAPGADMGPQESIAAPCITPRWITPKMAAFVQQLERLKPRVQAAAGAWRAIIFAQRQASAHALAAVISSLPCLSCFLSVAPLTGQSGDSGATNAQQRKTLDDFRRGKLNVLCSTAVAEEGLDVPECQLVVLFDLPLNARSVIQAIGRARDPKAHFLVLVNQSGPESATLASITGAMGDMRALALKGMKGERASGDDGRDVVALQLAADSPGSRYQVATTGAVVTLTNSIQMLQNVCSVYVRGVWAASPLYVRSGDPGAYTATVLLPSSFPVDLRTASATRANKEVAKAAAALHLMESLHKAGLINDHLEVPKPREEPAESPRATAGAAHAPSAGQPPAKVPDVLSDSPPPGSLRFFYEFTFQGLVGLDPPRGPGGEDAIHAWPAAPEGSPPAVEAAAWSRLGVLTPRPLPIPLPAFAIYPATPLVAVRVTLNARGQLPLAAGADAAAAVEVTPADARRVEAFTDALERVVFVAAPGVLRRCGAAARAVLLQPSAAGDKPWPQCVDWISMEVEPAAGPQADPSVSPHAVNDPSAGVSIVGRAVSTTYRDGGGGHRRYVVTEARPELTIHDPLDQTSTKAKMKDAAPETFGFYFRSTYGVSLPPDAVFVSADYLWSDADCYLSPRSMGTGVGPGGIPHRHSARRLLVLPVGCLRPLGAFAGRPMRVLPTLLWRLQSMCLAAELDAMLPAPHRSPVPGCPMCRLDGGCLRRLSLVHSAMTAASAHDGHDCERLEILGDAVLKYACSLRLHAAHPDWSEGQLTDARQDVVCNARLTKAARKAGLTPYLRAAQLAEGPAAVPAPYMTKGLADMFEALIGADYLHGGLSTAVGVLDAWGHLPVVPPPVEDAVDHGMPVEAVDSPSLAMLEARLGYTFVGTPGDPGGRQALLREALTHNSLMSASGPRAYERLEFLGDSSLDLAVLKHHFDLYASATPGTLTQLRAATVNNERLAQAAVGLRLAAHMLHGSAALHAAMVGFTKRVRERLGQSGAAPGDAHITLIARDAFGGTREEKAPKPLGDVVESVFAAVLIDTGYDLDRTWRLFAPAVQPVARHEAPRHPVSELQDYCDKVGYKVGYNKPAVVVGEKQTQVRVEVVADLGDLQKREVGQGCNKKVAKRLAAAGLLERLKRESV